MTLSISAGRKAFAAFATAAIVAAAFAPTSASAGDRHRAGYAAAGFAGGLLVGALAAGAASDRVVYEPRCWTERRRFVNVYGDTYVRRIRVCD